MLKFTATRPQMILIQRIVDRVYKEMADYPDDRLTLTMDLEATHSNGCPMDFVKLLSAPSFDFFHDVAGIRRHIDRETGKLLDCFLPRCAKGDK